MTSSTVAAVVDVAGPPVPAASQQFAPTGSTGSTGSLSTVVAAQGPVPAQALPATGTGSLDAAGLAAILLVIGVVATRVAGLRRRPAA